MKVLSRVLGVVAVCVLIPASAVAGSVLNFGITAPTPGVISYAGGTAPLVGKNIQVDNVLGISTRSHNMTTINIINGALSFTTGNFSGTSTRPPTWDFQGGGTISLTGCADLDGDGGKCDSQDVSGTLLTGIFKDVFVTAFAGSKFKIAGAELIKVKNPQLAAFFGLPSGTKALYSGGLSLSFNAVGMPPKGFKSSVAFSGDLVDAPPVSEPGSLALLGGGVLALGLWRRSAFQRASACA